MLATRVQDLEKEISYYFHNQRHKEMSTCNALLAPQMDASLNESLEHTLPKPLIPNSTGDPNDSMLIENETKDDLVPIRAARSSPLIQFDNNF